LEIVFEDGSLKIPLLSAFLVLAVSSCAAAAPIVTKTCSSTVRGFASRDAACISAMPEKITPNFEGLQQVTLSTNSIVQTKDGYLANYPGAKCESRHWDAKGSMTCIFTPDGRNVTEIAVAFEGSGLMCFTRHPLAQIIGNPA
jgi:hypothetical protein